MLTFLYVLLLLTPFLLMAPSGAPVDTIVPVYGVVVEKGNDKSRSNAKVRVGEPIILECKSNGIEITERKWIRSGQVIPEDQVHLIEEVDSIKLRIDKVDYHHQGVYECRIKDDSGTVTSATLKLDIKGGPVFGGGISPCSEPFASSYCQNGGKCWSGETEEVNCWCLPQYHGRHCEMAYTQQIPPKDLAGSTFSVGVLGGVLAFICLLLVVVLVYLFYYVKRDREERSDICSQSIQGMLISSANTEGSQPALTPISLSSVNINKVAPSLSAFRSKSLDNSNFGGTTMKIQNNRLDEVDNLASPTDSGRFGFNFILLDNQPKKCCGQTKSSASSALGQQNCLCRLHSYDRDIIKLDNVPVKNRKVSNISSTSKTSRIGEQLRKGLIDKLPARDEPDNEMV